MKKMINQKICVMNEKCYAFFYIFILGNICRTICNGGKYQVNSHFVHSSFDSKILLIYAFYISAISFTTVKVVPGLSRATKG